MTDAVAANMRISPSETKGIKKLLHVQTVDLDKYGKPTARELENAEIIRKRTGATVLLIAKPAQLRKPRNK